jgi:aerobic-type carbon monoxide dehydrogenase small subunit (CoxS/CutS family)
MPETIVLNVDGTSHTIEVRDPSMPLLYALRDEIGLANPHFGCGLAQCGACTVHLDGNAVRSCVIPTSAARGANITTIAGLGTPEHPHPLQQAFIDEQATLCGYCINGWIMTAAALLREKPHPTDAELRTGLSGVQCRCGAHMAILRAIKRVTTPA